MQYNPSTIKNNALLYDVIAVGARISLSLISNSPCCLCSCPFTCVLMQFNTPTVIFLSPLLLLDLLLYYCKISSKISSCRLIIFKHLFPHRSSLKSLSPYTGCLVVYEIHYHELCRSLHFLLSHFSNNLRHRFTSLQVAMLLR